MEESEVGHVRILVYPTKLGIRAGSSRVWRGEAGRGEEMDEEEEEVGAAAFSLPFH